ncbi:MAG: sugar transferase [Nocardioidaceae bacterium]|nr:sugar transferase [Nocardioidaceae bacterium]
MRKRTFDIVVITLAAVVWIPVVALAALAVLVFSGRPIFYRSRRWVGPRTAIEMVKLRVMVPNANKVVASTDAGCFLSTAPDSPLYTGVGRWLDRLGLNEIPQFVHVLRGEMTIIGPRPLTDTVRDCLGEQHPGLDQRWESIPAGLAGLPQLVGRMDLSDAQRLDLEAAYAQAAHESYSMRRDFMILLRTVLITFGLQRPLSFDEARAVVAPAYAPRRAPVRFLRLGLTPSRRAVQTETDAA